MVCDSLKPSFITQPPSSMSRLLSLHASLKPNLHHSLHILHCNVYTSNRLFLFKMTTSLAPLSAIDSFAERSQELMC